MKECGTRLIGYDDFLKANSVNNYYNNRWIYYNEVIQMICRNKYNINNAIELGAMKMPVISGCDTIDIEPEYHPIYLMDASITPWKIEKKYDLFIGLQVLEHLGGNQNNVFKEIKRIAKNIIISLPYNWNCPGDCHHGITEKTIKGWTGQEPKESLYVGSRIINNY
jgi:hypothetical protein